jgi:hypothetical protein
MNECIDIPKLELDRSSNVIESHNLGKLCDDFKPALYTAQVIICELKNK